MRNLLLLLFLSGLLQGCMESAFKNKAETNFLPGTPVTIISTQDFQNLDALSTNAALFGQTMGYMDMVATILDSVEMDNPLIAFYDQDSTNAFVISGAPILVEDSLETTQEDIELARFNIMSLDTPIYIRSQDDHILIGNDSLLIADKTAYKNELLNKLSKIETPDGASSLLLNSSQTFLPLSFIDKSLTLFSPEDGLYLTNTTTRDQIKFTGLAKQDSLSLELFSEPQISELLNVIPETSNQWQLTQIPVSWNPQTASNAFSEEQDSINILASACLEMASVSLNDGDLMIFHLNDASQIADQLNLQDPIDTYRETSIYKYEWSSRRTGNLQVFIPEQSYEFLAVTNNNVFISNSKTSLESCLTAYFNERTVSKSNRYKDLASELRTKFSYMSYANGSTINTLFPEKTTAYNTSFFQISKERDFIHLNGLVAKYSASRRALPTEQLASLQLDKELITSPQLVKNHINGGMDILVQDVENTLYLISNQGKLLWKKRLNGQVLGEVAQIDMYKNGRLQLAFCTQNRLYVLDRNGKEVAPFSIRFNDPITQPLSVFDYDNKRDYRLLLTQGRELLMLNTKGKRVKGFNYKPNLNISSQPKHFRVGRRDYIVFKAGKSMKILNRRGQIRINNKQSIDFSNNEIFLYQNQFSTTSSNGELVQIDTKGKLKRSSLNLPAEHQLTTTSKTLVTQTENKLNIKLKSVDLDYGIYTQPRIYYLNDKIYITTTDQQSKKVYLFDSQAKPIKGFPVFGTSSGVLGNLDNNRNLEFVLQTDERSISILRLR
ncbi:hypothetical protein [Winogradskyella aurantiaca]|uniref:hypothetical protein n=1 Tax=Winogradskyella aurantiaca TaxID=2219558 RepID=UPI0013005DCC|nr:hypothetical protein [Winogradskyella aurantiaca]